MMTFIFLFYIHPKNVHAIFHIATQTNKKFSAIQGKTYAIRNGKVV